MHWLRLLLPVSFGTCHEFSIGAVGTVILNKLMRGSELKTLEEKYEVRKKTIRKRYRVSVWSMFIGFVLSFPLSVFLDNVFPEKLIIPLMLIYLSIFLMPGLLFAASRCPKCQKPLMFSGGNIFKKYTNLPNNCIHCGFSFLSNSGHEI